MTTTTTYTGMDPSGRSSSRFVTGKVSARSCCSFTLLASLRRGAVFARFRFYGAESPGRDRAAKRPGFRGGAVRGWALAQISSVPGLSPGETRRNPPTHPPTPRKPRVGFLPLQGKRLPSLGLWPAETLPTAGPAPSPPPRA